LAVLLGSLHFVSLLLGATTVRAVVERYQLLLDRLAHALPPRSTERVRHMLALLQRHADALMRDRGLLFGCALGSAELLVANAARLERSRVRVLCSVAERAVGRLPHERSLLAAPAAAAAAWRAMLTLHAVLGLMDRARLAGVLRCLCKTVGALSARVEQQSAHALARGCAQLDMDVREADERARALAAALSLHDRARASVSAGDRERAQVGTNP
jgi:hypothetical protein